MSWFDDLLNSIRDALGSAANDIVNSIQSSISDVSGALGNVQSGIQGTISDAQNALGSQISGAYDSLTQSITNSQTVVSDALGGVQNTVLGKIADAQDVIYSTTNNVINTVDATVSSGLSNVVGTVSGAVSTLTSGIDNAQRVIGDAVSGAASALSTQVTNGLNTVGGALSGVYNGLTQDISSGLSNLQSGISGLVNGIGTSIDTGLRQVGTLVGSVGDAISASLANLSPDLTGIADAIIKGKPITDGIDTLNKLVVQGLSNALGGIQISRSNKQAAWEKLMSGTVETPEEALRLLFDPPPDEGVLGTLVELISAVVGAAGMFAAIGGVMARPRVQEFNQRYPTEVLSPADYAQAVVQTQITQDQARANAARSGIRADQFDLLVNIAGSPPGVMDMLEMWRRGFLSESEVDQGIRESRLKTKYLDATKKLRYTLPPISDVIRMAVREAWDDGVANQFGYDGDYPAKVAELAPQLGIDPDWIRRYWRAHWTLPSVSQLFEMLHRNPETGVTPAMVDQALRVNDVPPFWRDKLIAISYAPFTRIDIRRMYKVKSLTYDQVLQAYKDIGYNDARAKQLADFTVKLEDESGQLNPDTLDRKIYTALENLFVRSKRNEGDLRAAMQKFGWGETAIESEIEIAKLRQEAFTKVDSADASGLLARTVERQIVEKQIDLYIRNQGTLDQVSALMREYGWGDDIQQLIVKRATLDKLVDAAPSQKTQIRDLSQAAILEAYAARTFKRDEAKTRLIALGISADDAEILLDLKDYQQATATRNKIVTALQSAFIGNRRSEAQVNADLIKFGFDQVEISNLLLLWTLDKELRHKDFTEAQLATFLKHGVIDGNEYEKALVDLGWSAEQIIWWAKLRGVDASIV